MSLLQSHFRRSPSCHNWSPPVTDRHNQVEAVTCRNFTLMANTLLYLSEGVWVEGFCAQTWLDVVSVCTKLELRQRGAGRDTTLVMSPCAVNEKIFNSKWYLRDRFISGFHTLMTTSFLFIVPTFTNQKIDPSSTCGKQALYVTLFIYYQGSFVKYYSISLRITPFQGREALQPRWLCYSMGHLHKIRVKSLR